MGGAKNQQRQTEAGMISFGKDGTFLSSFLGRVCVFGV